MKIKLLCLLAAVALCSTGCNVVSYTRNEGGLIEHFSARGLFMNVAAQKMSVGGRTGTNIHGLSVTGVTGTGDTATLQAAIDAAVTAAVKAASPVPKP